MKVVLVGIKMLDKLVAVKALLPILTTEVGTITSVNDKDPVVE